MCPLSFATVSEQTNSVRGPQNGPCSPSPAPFTSWFPSSHSCLTCVFAAVSIFSVLSSSPSLSVAHLRWHLCVASPILPGESWPFLSMFVDFSPCSQRIRQVLQTISTTLPIRAGSDHIGRSKSKQARKGTSCLVTQRATMKLVLQPYHLDTPRSLPPLAH